MCVRVRVVCVCNCDGCFFILFQLTRRCNADALSGKRNVPVLSLGISKRAVTVATPTRVINDSILHVVGIPQLLTSLSELVCTSVHAVRDSRNCWNGMGMGRSVY